MFDYTVDLIFHEAGHIEYRRLRDWSPEKGTPFSLPKEVRWKELEEIVLSSETFPVWFLKLLLDNLTWDGLDEAYAMLIDREAAKRYKPEVWEMKKREIDDFLSSLNEQPQKPWYFWEIKENLKQRLHEESQFNRGSDSFPF